MKGIVEEHEQISRQVSHRGSGHKLSRGFSTVSQKSADAGVVEVSNLRSERHYFKSVKRF